MFFQDGCQAVKTDDAHFQKGLSPSIPPPCVNLVEIRQAILKIERSQTLKKKKKKQHKAKQYLPEFFFPGGNENSFNRYDNVITEQPCDSIG